MSPENLAAAPPTFKEVGDMRIDITGVDLVALAKKAYDLSGPQGLGFLHFERGGLTDAEAQSTIDYFSSDMSMALDMDYVKGRACKLAVFRSGDKLFIDSPWYDHTDIQLFKLLKSVWPEGKDFPELSYGEHGVACNCFKCLEGRK